MPLPAPSDRRSVVPTVQRRDDLEYGGNGLAREDGGTFVADALALPAISRPRLLLRQSVRRRGKY